MTEHSSTIHKASLAPLRAAMYNFTADGVRAELNKLLTENARVRYCFPFGDMQGAQQMYDRLYAPLLQSFPDLERRDTIVIAGEEMKEGSGQGRHWVGCAGYYLGTFLQSWLDIPPTGHMLALRFHEFYSFENGQVNEIQALWDIPDVMMQANAWPMAPSLGREWLIPAPATMDGIATSPYDEAQSKKSCQHVVDMLSALKRHPSQGAPEVMEMERYWHPRMNWYGPSGIGSSRGISGFRHWHQIPFLNAMPDRGQYVDDISYHFFGDGNYVGVTGWPNMIQTLTHAGWMGIAPVDTRITMRSLDFWRIEAGTIRENWVMVDLLDMYDQIGVDVFARLREFNKARNTGAIQPLDASKTI